MQRNPYLIGLLLVVVAIASACGGDGDGGGQPAATPTAAEVTPTATASPTAEATPAATPTDALAPTVTAPPGVRRAVPLVSASAFVEQFAGRNPTGEKCGYDEDTGLLNCTDSGVGMVQLDPPVRGTGVECEAVILDGELIGIICSSTEPLFAVIYQLAE